MTSLHRGSRIKDQDLVTRLAGPHQCYLVPQKNSPTLVLTCAASASRAQSLKHTLAPTQTGWNVSLNGCIVRLGLPPLPHSFSRSPMHARTRTGKYVRTHALKHADTPPPHREPPRRTHTSLRRPLHRRRRRHALHLSSGSRGRRGNHPGLSESVRRRKTGGVFCPPTPFVEVVNAAASRQIDDVSANRQT